MKLILGLVLITALSSPAFAQTPVSEPSPVETTSPLPTLSTFVPRGTLVVVETNHGTNSYGSETGAKITFTLIQDVVVNGFVVAKAGDVAEGAIQNAQEGKNDYFSHRAANLRVSVDKIYNFCGDTLFTDFVRSEFRQRQGILGSHKDVEITKGQRYQVPTERPQKICSEPTNEVTSPIPSDALTGDKN